MNPTDETPDTGTDDTHRYVEFAAWTPDPTDTPPFEETYATAHAAATAVLEQTGLTIGRNADRIVSTVLGAALLELERPWREELDAARHAAETYGRRNADLTDALEQAEERCRWIQIVADGLHTKSVHLATDANRRGQVIDDVERLLCEWQDGEAELDVVTKILTAALAKLRAELDR